MQDQLIECPRCESPYCYQVIKDAYLESNCLYCGYTTSTYMLEGSEQLKAIMSKLPKFYEDIKFKDSEGFIWVPRYQKVDGVGELYANLKTNGDFIWTYAPHIPVPASEKELYKNPDGSYREYKVDQDNAQHFSYNEYMLGLANLGLF